MIRGKKIDNKSTTIKTRNFIDFAAKIHNRFDIEVIDVNTGEIKQKAKAYNVICNNLWTNLLKGTAYFNYIFYGRGSGTPSSGDKSLFDYIGGQEVVAGNDWYSWDRTNGVYQERRMIQLTASTAVGETITEVGIASSDKKTTLCTHAMLQDMNGNPVSLQKTDTDVVNIYATVFIHYDPYGYDNGSVRMDFYTAGSTLLRLFAGKSINTPSAFVCTAALSFGGVPYGGFYPVNYCESGITWSYDEAARTKTMKMARVEASAGNLGGFLRIMTRFREGNSYVSYLNSMSIKPGGSWFPYSEIENEAVGTGDGTTVEYNLKFPFAHDVKVFVDGIEDTNITVDYAPNRGADYFHQYIEWLRPESTVDNHIPHLVSPSSKYTGDRQFYVPMHEVGVGKIRLYKVTSLKVSNDLKDWTEIYTSDGTKTVTFEIPEQYAHYKYWKGTCTEGYIVGETTSANQTYLTPKAGYTGNVLHFVNPPPAGSVITASYKSDCFAKDENHVFDLSITFHFGEYTEAQ